MHNFIVNGLCISCGKPEAATLLLFHTFVTLKIKTNPTTTVWSNDQRR